MKKLKNTHMQEALHYLSAEPEFNLFIIGDIEGMGMETDQVSCYTSDTWQEGTQFPYFILNYRNNFMVYSHTVDYNHWEIAAFLQEFQMRDLSGKDDLITPLIPYLGEKMVKRTHLARLNQVTEQPADMISKIRRLTKEDISAIYDLYIQIDEFASNYRGRTREKAYEDISMNIDKLGRTYGIFAGDTLLSVAQTAAENSTSAMVIGVATLPSYRQQGYAKATVTRLCQDCLQEGKRFLCLFYDNPAAGRIYRSIGFRELGIYMMLRNPLIQKTVTYPTA